ncbi:hypothetical protein [Bacillus licheniformis]|uniref:hypothetical protein n=3 Tax=Bacillus TaxID=1386 RepID=UPI000FFE2EE4|nr:hypothetical protein [Bacillus licheniformis]QAT55828.1 hypothetical protein EQY74_23475 [Bacillus licheniformis]
MKTIWVPPPGLLAAVSRQAGQLSAASRFPLKCPITCICKLPGLPLAIPETTAAMFLVISLRVNDDRKTLKQAEKFPFGHISANGKDTLKRIFFLFPFAFRSVQRAEPTKPQARQSLRLSGSLPHFWPSRRAKQQEQQRLVATVKLRGF